METAECVEQELRSSIVDRDKTIYDLDDQIFDLKFKVDGLADTASIGTDTVVICVPVTATKNIGINTDSNNLTIVKENCDEYIADLLECIRDLNDEVQSKTYEIERLSCNRNLNKLSQETNNVWSKGPSTRILSVEELSSLEEEVVAEPAVNHLQMELGMANSNNSCSSTNPHTKGELANQERRTRIAFLENQQAELETEIRLLKQDNTGSQLIKATERQDTTESGASQQANNNNGDVRDRLSSGMGDSLESSTELDAFSRLVVDKVLNRIKAEEPSKQHHVVMAQSQTEEEKSSLAVTQMRYLLQRERNAVAELQSVISTERLKALEWMERHNRERDLHRLTQAELSEMRGQMQSLHSQSMRDRDEIEQLANLYKSEQSQSAILESALATEKDNFRRLKLSLESERLRSREALDRDNDAIIDLRTALEVERERMRAGSAHFLMPSASTGNIPGRFRSLQESLLTGNKRPQQLCLPGTNEDVYLLKNTVEQLKNELGEEKSRVDALKACLDQERDKYKHLISSSVDQPQSITMVHHGKTIGGGLVAIQEEGRKKPNVLEEEVIVYYARKLEAEQLQKMQLQNQVARGVELIQGLESDLDSLRNQLKRKSSPNSTYEQFYIQDLEKKLDAHRSRENQISSDLQMAKTLIHDLQEENSDFLAREKQLVNRLEEMADQVVQPQITKEEDSEDNVSSKMSHLQAINEALHGKIRLLENRIGRLQDDLEVCNQADAVTTIVVPSKTSKPSCSSPRTPTKLRIWKLERQKKCLVWQKKYLQAILQNMEDSQDMDPKAAKKKPPTFRSVVHCVLAVIRIQGSAESWRQLVARSSSSSNATSMSDDGDISHTS